MKNKQLEGHIFKLLIISTLIKTNQEKVFGFAHKMIDYNTLIPEKISKRRFGKRF